MTTSTSSRSIFAALLGAGLLLSACGSSEPSSSATGSGGSASGGASATSTGATTSGTSAGGESGSTSSAASTTGSATSSTGTGGPTGCAGLPLCDDFEAATAGGPPDAATWTLVYPNCSGTSTLAVDDTQAHSGTKSVKVTGKDGYCNHVFFANTAAVAAAGKNVYGRFYLRLSNPLGESHTTFLALKDTADGGKDLRLGGQKQVMIWNRESDDATLPALSPTGVALSVSPPALAWRCIEFHIDESDGQMQTWVDGAEVAGLHQDGVPTQDIDNQWLNKVGWKPDLADLKLGWESYSGQDMTLWFDDVAIGSARIGCD